MYVLKRLPFDLAAAGFLLWATWAGKSSVCEIILPTGGEGRGRGRERFLSG